MGRSKNSNPKRQRQFTVKEAQHHQKEHNRIVREHTSEEDEECPRAVSYRCNARVRFSLLSLEDHENVYLSNNSNETLQNDKLESSSSGDETASSDDQKNEIIISGSTALGNENFGSRDSINVNACTTTIHVNSCSQDAGANSDYCEDNVSLIRKFILRHTTLVIDGRAASNRSKESLQSCYTLASYNGALDLLQHCHRRNSDEKEESNEIVSMKNVVLAIQYGMMKLMVAACDCTSATEDLYNGVEVTLFFTQYAFDLLSPKSLPLSYRRRYFKTSSNNKNGTGASNKNDRILTIQYAIGELFPQSICTDIFSNNHSSCSSSEEVSVDRTLDSKNSSCRKNPQQQNQTETITARMVYSVVDNVQVLARMRPQVKEESNNSICDSRSSSNNFCDDDNNDLKINGLVPKLRPYQREAVRWMLQREKSQPDAFASCDEWELAWFVLTSKKQEHSQFDGTASSSSQTGYQAVPLYEWKASPISSKSESSNVIYYSPFAGWLVKSYTEAHKYTAFESRRDQNYRVSGGILAETMGLGKTVEVLACILANQKERVEKGTSIESSNISTDISDIDATKTVKELRRKLDFLSDTEEEKKQDENPSIESSSPVVGIMDRHHNDKSHHMNIKIGNNNDHSPCSVATFPTSDEVTSDSTSQNATCTLESNLFQTPTKSVGCKYEPALRACDDKRKMYEMDIVETNFDHSLGECVCGRSTKFKDSLSMVRCNTCQEPMHGVCAGFSSEDQLRKEVNVRRANTPYFYQFCSDRRCPCCVASKHVNATRNTLSPCLFESRATLIITPPSILNQWEREIRRHTAIPTHGNDFGTKNDIAAYNVAYKASKPTTRPLKVIIYNGIRQICQNVGRTGSKSQVSQGQESRSARPEIHLIHPSVLADADIVLMSFPALMSDLGHSSDNPFVASSPDSLSGRNLRKRKRYRVLPSPLTAIKWWRICLDEAQRVETTTADSAKMALKLESHHRWCVSGTPIGKGKLDDLYGLLLFLGLIPFSDKVWFTKCFCSTHRGVMQRVKHLLLQIFWRSTKACADVRNQMGVPEQVEKKVLLQFSSIEKHFYERQLEETLVLASNMTGKDNKRKSVTSMLSTQLHRLRAACCHPQVGTNGIGRHKKRRKHYGHHSEDSGYSSVSVGNGVLSMEQILDRLIEEARSKCEEAQRLAVLHTNALACLAKLKIGAKHMGCTIEDTDESLLVQSCKAYFESLDLTDSNATPTVAVGEAVLSGPSGFRSSRKVIRDGKATLDWQIKSCDNIEDGSTSLPDIREVWSRIDFEGPSKNLVEIKIREVQKIPSDLTQDNVLSANSWVLLRPKDCVLQVSSSSVGGEFVDAASFTLGIESSEIRKENAWHIIGGFRTNKSKSWRILVKNYYTPVHPTHSTAVNAFYVGVEVQLFEPDISNDSLQRLHIMHNASLCLTALAKQLRQKGNTEKETRNAEFQPLHLDAIGVRTAKDIDAKVEWMKKECFKIESLYMSTARTIHVSSQRQLQEALKVRENHEADLSAMVKKINGHKYTDFWQDKWWDDLLSICHLHSTQSERMSICDKVGDALNTFYADTIAGSRSTRFPTFRDVDGLRVALTLYIQDILPSSSPYHGSCVHSVTKLRMYPTEEEVLENSQCHKCRADWNQVGPLCRHCKLETELEKLENDSLLIAVLQCMWKWLRDTRNTGGSFNSARTSSRVDDRASKFFDIIKAADKERLKARLAWRTHFDLLSDVDELNQCKETMRLAREGENLFNMTDEEQNRIVYKWDVATKCMDHAAKQAMAMATLRRNKDKLRYLKNQRVERTSIGADASNTPTSKNEDNCVVCLSEFNSERAVLRCGHSFHHSPCLEQLMKRSPGSITCPMRCTIKTKRDEVMIATNRRKDDGSKSKRQVKGSFGTKVTRLVSDLMDVIELGEKSIIFSQWDDMLEIVGQALSLNDISYVQVRSLTHIGDDLKAFRSNGCCVLLLNIKNGAEGLTLVEATHVFIVEPLLNCGLDSQAINRIHRIGQTMKTYVHRYLIENTIEMKIDRMRMDRQAEGDQNIEDSISMTKKKNGICAGGIDGGFSQEELEDVLR